MGKHWLDGLFTSSTNVSMIADVKGETALFRNLAEFDFPDYTPEEPMTGTWKYGKFTEASKEVKEATGEEFYNVEMSYMDGKMTMYGVISEDGKTVTANNFLGSG